MMGLCTAVAVVASGLAGRVKGQDVFAIPHPCIGWWAFDPAAAKSTAPAAPERLAAAVARFVTAEELVGEGTPVLAAAVLAASLECGVANRVVLVEVAGEPDARTGSWVCRRLDVVVEVPVESGAFEAAIRAAASHEGDVISGALALTGAAGAGMTGRWFSISGPPEMRRVEIAVGGGWTRIGLGSGVLQRWLESSDNRPGATAVLQRTVRGQTGGRQVFETVIDLDWLRESAPARFSHSQVGRELETMGLANARAFSFGVAAGGDRPVAGSWASRAEPLERAVGVGLAGTAVSETEKEWGWSVGLAPSVRGVADRSLAAVRAWRSRFGMMEFDRALERWSQSPKTSGALNVLAMGEVELRLGVGADGLLRGRAVLPKASAADVAAAIGSLPGVVEKGPGNWEMPLLAEGDDQGGVLRRITISVAPDGDGMSVEARVVGP